MLSYTICHAQDNKENKDVKQHFANLGNFKLENGSIIKDCSIGYRTYGKLNSAKSNCVLGTTWYGGTTRELESFTPGRTIDTSKYYLITMDALGNGISSSPSNDTTQGGASFPTFSIIDMIESQYQLLTKFLDVHHVHAVFGISMGGMQAFQWAVSYPDFEDWVISVVGTPAQTSYDLARWYFQLNVLQSLVAADTYEEMSTTHEQNFLNYFLLSNTAQQASTISKDSFNILIAPFHEEAPKDWNKNIMQTKANWYNNISQVKAMISLDATSPFHESLEETEAHVKAKMVIIVVKQDQVVNPISAIEFARFAHAKLFIQDSELGHMGANLRADDVKAAFAEIFSDQ